jgi:hypothetical protein
LLKRIILNKSVSETNDYISTAKNVYTQCDFNSYIIKCGGIDKLKKKNLDKIIHELPDVTISNDSFGHL